MAASSSNSSFIDLDSFTSRLQKALLQANRLAVAVPPPQDLKFQRTLSRPLGKNIDALADRLRTLTSDTVNLARAQSSKSVRDLAHDDLTEAYQSTVVDVTDGLLEAIDTCLDEHRRAQSRIAKGKGKELNNVEESPSLTTRAPSPPSTTTNASEVIFNSKSTPKSQLAFLDAVDNSRSALFVPLLRNKPHGLSPLTLEPAEITDASSGKSRMRVPHPYTTEIDAALSRPLPDLRHEVPQEDSEQTMTVVRNRMKETPFTFVDTEQLLDQCITKLRSARALAIDLEHHNYRSYRGFTSLIQISTFSEDFVIDPLVPTIRAALHKLNEVTASPDIVKVLHGAESDIIWLQRDFGVYIVNLFDTFHASRTMERTTRHSLASLLHEYTDFVPDKRYQMADWRVRPLTEPMLQYARSDTHFLLHIYMRLLQDPRMTSEKVDRIRQLSASTAKQVYEHFNYDFEQGYGDNGWLNPLTRSGKLAIWGVDGTTTGWVDSQGMRKFETYRGLHDWRDQVARQRDESTGYILPSAVLSAIVDRTPTSEAELVAVLGQDASKYLVGEHEKILEVCKKARARADETSARRKAEASDRSGVSAIAAVQWGDGSPRLGGPPSVQSALFQQVANRNAAARHPKKHFTTFTSILAKIHSDLLQQAQIADHSAFLKSQETALLDSSERKDAEEDPDIDVSSAVSEAPVLNGDHLYIPKRTESPASAQERALGLAADTIVQTSKRVKHKSSKRKQAEPSDDIKPFDYSKVKSVLDAPVKADDNGSSPAKKAKKEKKVKGERVDDSSFPRAPKAMSGPKSGNRSQTFF